MAELDKIKNSEIWAFSEKKLRELPIEEKIKIYAKVFYPEQVLDQSMKLDVLFRIPEVVKELSDYLTHKEIEVLKMMSYHCTYDEICKEIGYANRSSITGIVNNIRRKIIELVSSIKTDEELEEQIIEMSEGKCQS